MAAWDLSFLGTGSAYPSPHRGASCMVLRHDTGCWVFDCGEGSQVQLMRSAVKPGKLYGLPGLLCTLSASLAEDSPPLEIFGPTGLRQFVRVSLNFARSQLGYQYVVHELHHDVQPAEHDGLTDWDPDHRATGQPHPKELPGEDIKKNSQGYWEVCHDGTLTVRAATLKHRIVSFGYVITEDMLPGKLLVDKLKSLGVPPGPLYARLKRGETIESPQGIKILPGDVVGPNRPGRKIVILGDTCDNRDIAPLCVNADLIVHEATNENAHEDQCRGNGHSTPGMAATFCHEVGALQLILTHFSQRYKRSTDEVVTDSGDESVDKLVREAKETLSKLQSQKSTGSIIEISAADDLRVYHILARNPQVNIVVE